MAEFLEQKKAKDALYRMGLGNVNHLPKFAERSMAVMGALYVRMHPAVLGTTAEQAAQVWIEKHVIKTHKNGRGESVYLYNPDYLPLLASPVWGKTKLEKMPPPMLSVRQIALRVYLDPAKAVEYVSGVYKSLVDDDRWFDPLFALMRGEFLHEFNEKVTALNPSLLNSSTTSARQVAAERRDSRRTVAQGVRKDVVEKIFVKPANDSGEEDFLLSPIAADLIEIPSLGAAKYQRTTLPTNRGTGRSR